MHDYFCFTCFCWHTTSLDKTKCKHDKDSSGSCSTDDCADTDNPEHDVRRGTDG